MRAVCVFCGSNPGVDPVFLEGARALGRALLAADCTLIYGGAKVGLMGALADTVLVGGGKVIGVLPEALVHKEVAHRGLTELHIVSSMHERKKMMADLSDAFIALPGGLGTLEELFEVWTWAQLGLHRKAIGICGPKAFFAPLFSFLDALVAQKFVLAEHRQMIAMEEEPSALLERLARYEPVIVPRWIDRADS